MIQRLKNIEYLKRIDNMSIVEKTEYVKRVGEWLDRQAPLLRRKMGDAMASFQNVIQFAAYWNDQECEAWTEGARLLSAMSFSEDTWLPDKLYSVSAKRCIRQMIKVLGIGVTAAEAPEKPKEDITPKEKQEPAEVIDSPSAEGSGNGKAVMKPLSVEQPKVMRPKHIDQYVHLLPAKTQERAALVNGLLRDMDRARENARLLAASGGHPDKTGTWAKTITSIDSRLKSIYRELDDEWDKLVASGRVTVDDFGNAHVAEVAENTDNTAKKPGRPPLTREQKAAKQAEKAARKKADDGRKATLLRKWLIDTRYANNDDHTKKWLQRYKDMVKLGGDAAVTDKVREAAAFYGIDITGGTEK